MNRQIVEYKKEVRNDDIIIETWSQNGQYYRDDDLATRIVTYQSRVIHYWKSGPIDSNSYFKRGNNNPTIVEYFAEFIKEYWVDSENNLYRQNISNDSELISLSSELVRKTPQTLSSHKFHFSVDQPPTIVTTNTKTGDVSYLWCKGDFRSPIYYRHNDQPTYVFTKINGEKQEEWRIGLQGKAEVNHQRENDLPTKIVTFSDKVVYQWLKNGQLSRDNDNPTIVTIYKDGSYSESWTDLSGKFKYADDKPSFIEHKRLPIKTDSEVKNPVPLGEIDSDVKKQIPLGEADSEVKKPVPLGEADSEVKKPVPLGEADSEVKKPIPLGEADSESFIELPFNSLGSDTITNLLGPARNHDASYEFSHFNHWIINVDDYYRDNDRPSLVIERGDIKIQHFITKNLYTRENHKPCIVEIAPNYIKEYWVNDNGEQYRPKDNDGKILPTIVITQTDGVVINIWGQNNYNKEFPYRIKTWANGDKLEEWCKDYDINDQSQIKIYDRDNDQPPWIKTLANGDRIEQWIKRNNEDLPSYIEHRHDDIIIEKWFKGGNFIDTRPYRKKIVDGCYRNIGPTSFNFGGNLSSEKLLELAQEIVDDHLSKIAVDDAEICSICLEDFTQKAYNKLPCGHFLHLDCMMKLIINSIENSNITLDNLDDLDVKCPLCRSFLK